MLACQALLYLIHYQNYKATKLQQIEGIKKLIIILKIKTVAHLFVNELSKLIQ